MSVSSGGFDPRSAPFFLVCRLFHLFLVWRGVVSQPSTSRTWYIVLFIYAYRVRVLLPLVLLLVCCHTVVDAAAAACCCCSSSFAGWQKLLLVHWIWFQCFLSLHSTRFFKNEFLGSSAAFTASIYLYYILVNYGMHGAKAGVSPPRRSPPCIIYVNIRYQ